MTEVRIPATRVEIVRAFKTNPIVEAKSGVIAHFSLALIDDTNVVQFSLNDLVLKKDEMDRYVIHSQFKSVRDDFAPEEVPDDQAFKPLYFISFLPGIRNMNQDPNIKEKNAEIKDSRYERFDLIAQLVFDKIAYFKKLKESGNESSDSSGKIRQRN